LGGIAVDVATAGVADPDHLALPTSLARSASWWGKNPWACPRITADGAPSPWT